MTNYLNTHASFQYILSCPWLQFILENELSNPPEQNIPTPKLAKPRVFSLHATRASHHSAQSHAYMGTSISFHCHLGYSALKCRYIPILLNKLVVYCAKFSCISIASRVFHLYLRLEELQHKRIHFHRAENPKPCFTT